MTATLHPLAGYHMHAANTMADIAPPRPTQPVRHAADALLDVLNLLDGYDARIDSVTLFPHGNALAVVHLSDLGRLPEWIDTHQLRPAAHWDGYGSRFEQLRVRDALLVWRAPKAVA
jgi:hypothetical protein